MSLGMEVGLGPGDCVRWGQRTPLTKGGGAEPPRPKIFGWMDEAGTWHGCRPQPRRLCVRWGPSPLPPKGGGTPLPNFRPISIVAN